MNDDDLEDDYHKNMEDIFHGGSDQSQCQEAEMIESPRAMLKKMRDASKKAMIEERKRP